MNHPHLAPSPPALGQTAPADRLTLEAMTGQLSSAPERDVPSLTIRTTALPPDVFVSDLWEALPDDRPVAWVRHGEGLVGWGQALRCDTWGPGRFADAEAAWRAITAQATIHDDVKLPGTGAVAFGTFAFEDTRPGEQPSGTLIVPRMIIGRRGTSTWLTTVTTGDEATPTLSPVTKAGAPGAVRWGPGAVTTTDWLGIVTEAIDRIAGGELAKVVLARDEMVHTEHPIDPRWLLRRLAAAYDSCWTFAVDGLVGATPELLVRTHAGDITSRVLAGTIAHATTPEGSAQRAIELASSVKDLEEHAYAVQSVAQALHPFCRSLTVPSAPFVLDLPNVMHLATDITGKLADSSGDAPPSSLSLAAALHPSAAVCGTPTPAAQQVIRDIEGMDRARYAGPVGWCDAHGNGEWGIALRCAELDPRHPNQARIFAGCGIVAGSQPAAELAESTAKLQPLRDALGGSVLN